MNASNDSRTGPNSHGSAGTGTRGGKGSHLGWTFANACILGMTAWIAFSSGGSPFASRAEAGAPPVSARNAVDDWLSGPDAPVPPTSTSRWRACSNVSAPEAFEKAQTLTLESILPTQLYWEASNRPAA